MKKVRKAIIPVAGMGTRFLPETKVIPKEMLPIVDKPTLQYIIEEAANSGIEEVLLVNSPNKKCIEEYFTRNVELENKLIEKGKEKEAKMLKDISEIVKISYITQEKPLGSGNAILIAKEFVNNEAFAVLYGDDLMYNDEYPILKQLIDKYNENNSSIIGCLEVDEKIVDRYGIVKLRDDGNKIESIIEKPKIEDAPSNLAGLGRYILNPEIFDYLENLSLGCNSEYQLTDAMLNMMKDYDYEACKIDGTYYDTGSKEGYLKANIAYALKREDLKDKVERVLNEIK